MRVARREAPSRWQAKPPPRYDCAIGARHRRERPAVSSDASEVREAMPAAGSLPSQKTQVSIRSAQAPQAAAMDSCNTLASKPQ
jgi:hypothetical protein